MEILFYAFSLICQATSPAMILMVSIMSYLYASRCLTFTPPESSPSGQFWSIYALIGGVRVNLAR